MFFFCFLCPVSKAELSNESHFWRISQTIQPLLSRGFFLNGRLNIFSNSQIWIMWMTLITSNEITSFLFFFHINETHFYSMSFIHQILTNHPETSEDSSQSIMWRLVEFWMTEKYIKIKIWWSPGVEPRLTGYRVCVHNHCDNVIQMLRCGFSTYE